MSPELSEEIITEITALPDHSSSLVIQALESGEVSEWDENIVELIENIKWHLDILDETEKEKAINTLKHLTGHDLVNINEIV